MICISIQFKTQSRNSYPDQNLENSAKLNDFETKIKGNRCVNMFKNPIFSPAAKRRKTILFKSKKLKFYPFTLLRLHYTTFPTDLFVCDPNPGDGT